MSFPSIQNLSHRFWAKRDDILDGIGLWIARRKTPGWKFPRLRLTGNSTFSHLAVFSSAIVALAVGIFALAMLSYLDGVSRDDLKTKASVLANSIRSSICQDLLLDERFAVVQHCQEIVKTTGDILYIVVTLTDDSALIHHKGGWATEQHHPYWRSWEDASGMKASFIENSLSKTHEPVLHLAQEMKYMGTIPLGWVHVGMSMEDHHQTMSRFKGRVAWIAMLTLSCGVLSSLAFSLRFTRPLVRLREFAEAVAHGDLERTVEVSASEEITNLAQTMNWMTRRLAESRSQLEESFKHQASLREKEVLLREIHHRVKNNMQILASLIRIQCRGLKNEETRKILKESETRIRSMALLHQKLYESANISEISFAAYTQVLVGELQRLYHGNGSLAHLAIDIPPDFQLGLDTALPCGLIINELVSNAFKYAFPNGQSGTIRVAVSRLAAHGEGFTLVVEDDGAGLPANYNPEQARSLGSRLVSMLVEQLNGRLDVQFQNPTRFTMELRRAHYTERVAKAA